MTTQKTQPTNQKPEQVKFMDQLYREISNVVSEHGEELNTDGQSLTDDILQVAEYFVKQSFKNGIQAGQKRAQQGKQTRQKGQNPQYDKDEKAVEESINR